MQLVAAGWLVLQFNGKAIDVGILAVMARGPVVVGSLYGGVLADRLNRRTLSVVLLIVQTTPAAILAILAADGQLDIAEIYLLILAGAIPGGILMPTMSMIGPDTVPQQHQRKAIAYGAVAFNCARLLGPALGGGIVALLGADVCFAINAVSFAAVILVMVFLPRDIGAKAERPAGESVSLRQALRATRTIPLVTLFFAATLVFFALVGPIEQLAPVIAQRHGEGAEVIGYLLSALALGSIVGTWRLNRLERKGVGERAILGAALAISGVALAALGFSGELVISLLAMFVAGICWQLVWTITRSGIQYDCPPEISGRMVGLFFTVSGVGLSVGVLILGWLIDDLGVNLTFSICAGLLVLFGLGQLQASRRASVSC